MLLAYTAGFSQLRLPSILQSGMVLQQQDSVNLWGWSGPSWKVTVTTSWDNQTYTTEASELAKWKLKVKTPAAGGPYQIKIESGREIILDDVMIGEVWVCSGQSNMEWNFHLGVKDIAAEFPTAYNRNIRLYQIEKTGSDYPQEDIQASWAVCDSNTLKTFSAVGYFFGKHLHSQLNVPIGLINASWGGTPAEPWTPEELIENDAELKQAAEALKTVAWWPVRPGKAYNAMIAPIVNHSIAGVIWYQGESNVPTSSTYRKLFTTMIDSWRAAWQKELPFYYVQIAPFAYEGEYGGALLRQAQLEASTHPRTGMVVITDLVDNVHDIHPGRKNPVGTRLANYALATTYNKPIDGYRSPEFAGSSVEKGKLVLRFNYADKGMRLKGARPEALLIADENAKEWLPAQVKIEKNTVIAWHPKIKKPAHVRYGFGNILIGNLESVQGLPVAPFRTDHEPLK